MVGRNRQPSLQDRVNLPFVDATIMEIQRIGDIGNGIRRPPLDKILTKHSLCSSRGSVSHDYDSDESGTICHSSWSHADVKFNSDHEKSGSLEKHRQIRPRTVNINNSVLKVAFKDT